MSETPKDGPDPQDDDLAQALREEVEKAASPDDTTDENEIDEPAFKNDPEAMDAPPPG